MLYLVVYCIFAYLFNFGIVLAEMMLQVKLGRFHIVFLILAPILLPVYLGYWCTHMINPNAAKNQAEANIVNAKP